MQQGEPPQQKLPKTIQSPNKPSVPPPRHRPSPRGELSPPALCSQVLNLSASATGCLAKNYLQDSGRQKPLTHTQLPACATETFLRAGIVKILPFAWQIPPLKSGQIFTLFFIRQGAVPRKGKAKLPPTLARWRPLQTETPRALSTLQPQRARTRKTSSSQTTPQKS